MTANIETFSRGLAEELDYSVDGDTGMVNIAEATKIIAAALEVRERSKWVSVAELDKLPLNGEDVLIWLHNFECRAIAHRQEMDSSWFWLEGEYSYAQSDVSHWQPLPVPPEDK